MNLRVKARVKSIHLQSTARGRRLYVIFQTVDGREIGIWGPSDYEPLAAWHEGDRVLFREDARGCLHLVPKSPFHRLVEFFKQ